MTNDELRIHAMESLTQAHRGLLQAISGLRTWETILDCSWFSNRQDYFDQSRALREKLEAIITSVQQHMKDTA